MGCCLIYSFRRLKEVFKTAKTIPFDDHSRIVFMSDCHRGDGSYADNFLKNQHLFFAALTQYNYLKYTYIELGDGDELWENDKLSDSVEIYGDVFWLLSKFYRENRLYMLFGNHDMVKGKNGTVKRHLDRYYDVREKRYVPLFPGIKFHEGLILEHNTSGHRIFLVHGHQADFFNDTLWRLSRFLVRYVWKPLELVGVNDPTSAAKNYKRKKKVEKKLTSWVIHENRMLIAGHTHRPVLPALGEPLYFNDGSCVHPRCITAVEISDGNILLVKWSNKTKFDGTLYVGREILVGPVKLEDYFALEFNNEL
jgi:UDP-2,3-diacylglucosamine pyrophosphatase LpxH